MFAENRHYGHAEALRSYCGVRRHAPLLGRLQHGWMPGPGVRQACRDEPWARWVWSRRNLEQCHALGLRGVEALGAPWLYLPPLSVVARSPRSLLSMPFHGWDRQRLLGDFEAYAASLETLEREGFGPVTVCLYHLEHQQPACREPFERRGYRVITMGPPSRGLPFLLDLRTTIAQHGYVTSNRVATAIFYALATDRAAFLHGPVMGLASHDDPTGEAAAAWQERHFPELAYGRFRDRVERAIGERELGLEYRRPPEELRRVLGLRRRDTPRRLVFPARIAAHVARGILREGPGFITRRAVD